MIVVPSAPPGADRPEQIPLAPGDVLDFGRSGAPGPPSGRRWMEIGHPGVSRYAGQVTAQGGHWGLSNLSLQTYVVENPEGAGEHIKIAPGRVDAPIPFEFSRVVLPAAGELLTFDVWAPRHEYLVRAPAAGRGAPTVMAFPLDRDKRYFLVLAALCEPRLRGEPHAPLPTTDQIVRRLRPVWPAASRTTVQWNLDYLAVKLRLNAPSDLAASGTRQTGKKEALASLALRFDVVREEDLTVLRGPREA
ncbi:FHA domain-containing protein [Streptomyces sp. NPDC051940]|uniref:FHA domain-containing protein n=1 Tax=Streptomyces sp. NPDC051940 TaxID=3155675 RepID=UPI00343FE07B